ncbi:Grx4 family monothiol glutaredoxin [Pseudanabaenaceae cyanobacterium LEGE 13415]|nr:Grx4 family monothiol glutaredoxin [Pseudanabaenaceae cyanobacterium LEGE 13415]
MSDAQARIKSLVDNNKIMVFMKGSKLMPMCGFSNNVVQILNTLGVPYETVDVLEDSEIRQGIKDFSNWPTIPQVYINGEFIGGSDIMIEMYQKGELQQLVEVALAS